MWVIHRGTPMRKSSILMGYIWPRTRMSVAYYLTSVVMKRLVPIRRKRKVLTGSSPSVVAIGRFLSSLFINGQKIIFMGIFLIPMMIFGYWNISKPTQGFGE